MISIEEKSIALSEIFIEQYNFVLKQLFSVAYETTPQAFRLSNNKNIKIIHAKFDESTFMDDSEMLFLIQSENANLGYALLDLSHPSNYNDYSEYTSDLKFMSNKISEKLNIYESDILFTIYSTKIFLKYEEKNSEEYKKSILKTFQKPIFGQMKELVRNDGSQFQKHSNLISGYYAKNAARYAYSLLDLDPIIKKVNDEDFEYQLDQAIASYDNSLYMASCATLGVCLETVCKLILINNGKKIKDSDPTMLDKLSERLKSEGLIKYKDKSRIDVCYKVRNLSSHTSPGKVTQNDCHFLINTIQSLVEEYF